MKKAQEIFIDVVGGIFMFTYEHIPLMIFSTLSMICGIIKLVSKSLYYYGLQLDHLERTLETTSINHLYMWMFDGLALVLIGILFLYISEAFRFFTKKSLLEHLVKKITFSEIEE